MARSRALSLPGAYCSERWRHLADKPTAPVSLASHPENSKTGLFQGRVQSGAQAESQNHAGVGGIDDAVIPESVRTKENAINRSGGRLITSRSPRSDGRR